MTSIGVTKPWVWKPVAKMITSAWRSSPSWVRIGVPGHLSDRIGDELDIGPGEGGIPSVGGHHTLAANRVWRGQLATKIGIADGLGDLTAGDNTEGGPEPGLARLGQGAELAEKAESGAAVKAL